MVVALVTSFILCAALFGLGHATESFYIFDANHRAKRLPLSDSRTAHQLVDKKLVVASKLFYAGAFISAIVFLALLIAIGAGA